MTKLALHWKILLGLALGLLVGIAVNLTFSYDTWLSLGVDHPAAYIAGDHDALVPALPQGIDAIAQLDPDDPVLASLHRSQLTDEQIERLGLELVPANQDPTPLAAAARFVRNLTDFVGDLFIRFLRFIAVPLVLFSLVAGTASLNDIGKTSRIGGKAISIYLATTALAITLGLLLANTIKPGTFVDETTRIVLEQQSTAQASEKLAGASTPAPDIWTFLLDIIPTNPINAIAQTSMLQIVFAALALGIGLTLIPRDASAPVIAFFQGMTDVVIKLVEVFMRIAPYAVFALIAPVVADMGLHVLAALLIFSLTVIAGLCVMVFLVYPAALRMFRTGISYRRFFWAISPAQLLAFSSSSSSATLPVTMDCCEKRLGVSEDVSAFVLPVGATVNMDGTALYMGISAIFISQIFSYDLTIANQLAIILTVTLASIGTAAVPSAGVVMLVIVLEQAGMAHLVGPGVAIIFGVDRLLDMCRTTCNVTGDCMVAAVVASSEKELASQAHITASLSHEKHAGLDQHP